MSINCRFANQISFMKRKFRICFFGFCLFFINLPLVNCVAQNLFFEKISGQEIDPSTSIHGIAKDSLGYIWFGSWNGVYRYDGKSFDYFYHNPNKLNS